MALWRSRQAGRYWLGGGILRWISTYEPYVRSIKARRLTGTRRTQRRRAQEHSSNDRCDKTRQDARHIASSTKVSSTTAERFVRRRCEPDDKQRNDHVLCGEEQVFAVCRKGKGVSVCVGESDGVARCFENLGGEVSGQEGCIGQKGTYVGGK